MPEVPLWVAITSALVVAAGAAGGAILAWVKWGVSERPAADADTDRQRAEAERLRAETENITVTSLKDTIAEIRALSDTRKADIDDLREQMRQQRDEHRAEIAELRRLHLEEVDRVKREMTTQINDLRRRLDRTPDVPPADTATLH